MKKRLGLIFLILPVGLWAQVPPTTMPATPPPEPAPVTVRPTEVMPIPGPTTQPAIPAVLPPGPATQPAIPAAPVPPVTPSAVPPATAVPVEKPPEEVRGGEIRGGDQYASAVPLKAGGVEYRLDHHQRKDQYDYFYVDLKKGQVLTLVLTTMDKGIAIDDRNQVRETDSPCTGARLMDSAYQQISQQAACGRHERREVSFAAEKSDRIYLLIGRNGTEIHKDSPFQVQVVDYFDAASGMDAGDDLLTALPITGSDYQNWLSSHEDKDAFQMDVKGGENYSFVLTPQSMEVTLSARGFDQDRIQLFSENAANNGAVLRVENVVPKRDGKITLLVRGYYHNKPVPYSLHIERKQAESVQPQPPPPPPSAGEIKTRSSTEEKLEKLEKLQEKVERAKKRSKEIKKTVATSVLLTILGIGVLVMAVIGGVVVLIIVLTKKKKGSL